MNKLMPMVVALPMISLCTGCFPFFFDDDDGGDPPPQVSTRQNEAPDIDIDIPNWPPPGPDSAITIVLRDDSGLDTMEVSFRNDLVFFPFGISDEISIPATELGEGLGFLDIIVTDISGAQQESFVSNLLIDLTPPEITLGATHLRHANDSDVELWVADAWILGHVELEVGDVTLVHEFEPGYPSTLGESWDYSLVQFATTDLPEGTGGAIVTLYDAAGNVAQTEVELTLDGQAPTVAITSPAPATIVSGEFDVSLTAADAGGGPVWLELRVEGTPVATAVGPSATVQLDAMDLTPGSVDLEAVAIDQAGNVSVLAVVPITVQ